VSAAGSIYERGLSGGSAEPFGYGLCIIFLGLFIAVPLWRMKITTLGDLFRIRYSRSVERLAVLLMVPTSVFWAAAQVRAFGQVLSAASGFDPALTVTIGAAVVVAYTIFGGLLADAWTDLVQGIALIVGLAVLFVVILRDVGTAGLATVDPQKLQLFDTTRSPLGLVEDWAIPVVGSLVAAELVARVIAARSPQVARNATLAGGAMYLMIGMIPVTLGLLGLGLVPGLAEPEQVLPTLALQYLPTALYVVFAGALVSAILSTVDSALLVAGSLVSHNLMSWSRCCPGSRSGGRCGSPAPPWRCSGWWRTSWRSAPSACTTSSRSPPRSGARGSSRSCCSGCSRGSGDRQPPRRRSSPVW